MRDRDQKQKALQLSVANRWFPQLEVDVEPGRSLSTDAPFVTDLDVLSSIPDPFTGFRSIVFDCKTGPRESPVNRSLWLIGVLQRLQADHGFCILKRNSIELDHRLMATRMRVILLTEEEFDLYARTMTPEYALPLGAVAELTAWESFFAIPARFPKLVSGVKFIRSGYWMVDDAAEACRKTLHALRSLHPEFDPAKREQVALFFDFCSLFARSLAIVAAQLFKAYLQPKNQSSLSDALLVMLYGGRDAYDHRNELFRFVKSKAAEQPPQDLSLPEWERFLQLARQLLDAPTEVQRVPLILREVGFSFLSDKPSFSFAQELCQETAQGARFALMIADYLCRATKLPPEFIKIADDTLLPLQRRK
jgi:hypothetical protein